MARPGAFPKGNQLARKSAFPRGRFITQHLISFLHEVVEDPAITKMIKKGGKPARDAIREKATRLHWLVKALFNLAMAGDLGAMKYIVDRIEGTPIQTVAFAPEKSAEEIEAERNAMEKKRAELQTMTPDQKNAMYAQTLNALNSDSPRPN